MEQNGSRTGGAQGEPMVECCNCHRLFPIRETAPRLVDWTETQRLCFACERALYSMAPEDRRLMRQVRNKLTRARGRTDPLPAEEERP